VLDVVEQGAAAARRRAAAADGRADRLQTRHEAIGDVRGMGLLGDQLVEDRETSARYSSARR
jgi:4-aminobutyrate aminotransferase-like enzyme